MLASLSIRNLAVIERVDLDFGPGLTVLTGETGAGKSILLDALGLALGRRADAALVRPGCEDASVAAAFQLPPHSPALALLRRRGIEAGEEVVLRRRLRADGRSKAFVDGVPVAAALLAELGESLVEAVGQHDQRGLLKAEVQRDLLDRFGGCDGLRRQLASRHGAWRRCRQRLEQAAAGEAEREERRRDLEREIADLERLAPRPGEDEELATLRRRLGMAEKIAEALGAASQALEEAEVEEGLRRAAGALNRARAAAAGALDEAAGALDRALLEVAEAADAIQRAGRDLDADRGRLEEVEERLFALRAAARRHAVAADRLPEVAEAMARELADLESGEESLRRLREAEAEAGAAFDEACRALSARRAAAAGRLNEAVARELAPLRMAGAAFEAGLESLAPEERNAWGAERVCFRVVTVPGAPPGPLNRIASGGELSRFMLALKVAAHLHGSPAPAAGGAPAVAASVPTSVATVVFDEIDAGVGGAVADAVGERLQRLGRGAQVLAVTHAPQVAARADRHVLLIRRSDGATVAAGARELDDRDRREELARMLAGADVTDAARAAAMSLLGSSSP